MMSSIVFFFYLYDYVGQLPATVAQIQMQKLRCNVTGHFNLLVHLKTEMEIGGYVDGT